jgi:hypothetical protein
MSGLPNRPLGRPGMDAVRPAKRASAGRSTPWRSPDWVTAPRP